MGAMFLLAFLVKSVGILWEAKMSRGNGSIFYLKMSGVVTAISLQLKAKIGNLEIDCAKKLCKENSVPTIKFSLKLRLNNLPFKKPYFSPHLENIAQFLKSC